MIQYHAQYLIHPGEVITGILDIKEVVKDAKELRRMLAEFHVVDPMDVKVLLWARLQ